MYGYESWTIKKAECWGVDVFELWCYFLRAPWTARRSNQSIVKEINPEYSLKDWCWSWRSNTLATWCEEPTYWKRPWCWERLKKRRRGWQRIRWLDSITHSMDMSLSKLWEIVKDREDRHVAVPGVVKSQTSIGHWATPLFAIVLLRWFGKTCWRGPAFSDLFISNDFLFETCRYHIRYFSWGFCTVGVPVKVLWVAQRQSL